MELQIISKKKEEYIFKYDVNMFALPLRKLLTVYW